MWQRLQFQTLVFVGHNGIDQVWSRLGKRLPDGIVLDWDRLAALRS